MSGGALGAAIKPMGERSVCNSTEVDSLSATAAQGSSRNKPQPAPGPARDLSEVSLRKRHFSRK